MIAALEGLDVSTAGWLAQRDPALVHLPDALATVEPGWNLHDVQWTPGRGCRLAFEVTSAETPASTFVAIDVDPSGWSQHDLRDDPGLPDLVAGLDPDLVSEKLAALVSDPIRDCRVRPVRYRPNVRCVVRYDLRTSSGPARYFAKVFSSSVFADVAARTSRVSAAARPVGLRVSQVLAVWPEQNTTVAAAIPGRSASAVLRDETVPIDRRIALARDLGGILADLHTLTGVPVPTRTPSDHLSDVTALLATVRILDATLADRISRLVDRLGPRLPVDDRPQVLIHGAFRPGQVVVDDAGQLHLLDLDGVCRGDAAQDLGSASAYLSWQAIRQPSQELELRSIDEAFLAGHASRGSAVEPVTLAWWRAAALAQIAVRRFRRLEIAHWALVPQIIDRAESLLDGSQRSKTR